jgi:hypothetical protein
MFRPPNLARSFALATLLVAVVGYAASAAPKVAITPIDGDSEGDVREAVTDALSGNDLVVVAKKEVNRAVKELEDISNFTETDAKKLSKAVEADAVVHGKLMDREGQSTLKVQLFVKGKKQKGFSITFKNAKAPKFRRAMHDTVLKKIKNAMPADAAEPEGEGEGDGEDEPAPVAKKEKPCKGKKCKKVAKEKAPPASEDEEPVKETKKKPLKDGEDEENPLPTAKNGKKKGEKKETAEEPSEESTAEGEGDEEGTRKAAKKETAKKEQGEEVEEKASTTKRTTVAASTARPANRAAVRLDIGASFDGRTMTFVPRADLPDDQRPTNFRSKPVPGARFDVDIFPLGFGNPYSAIAGIGLAVEYDKTIGEKIKDNASGGASAVTQQHYLIAGQYRLVLGKTPTSPSITAGFGYGRRTFQIQSRESLMAEDPPPDTDYKYYAPRAGVRFPIAGSIALLLDVEGMLIFNAGPIQRADQYGRAKVIGFAGAGGAEYVIGNRIAIRALGQFNQIGFTFVGRGGDLANNRDMNPDTLDVGGATDRSIGGVITLAVLY